MTSRNLYINLMREDIKRRVWAWVLISLVFFFSMPIILMMDIGNTGEYLSAAKALKYKTVNVRYELSLENSTTIALTIIIAVISGLTSFSYLFSKKKVDFYHSIPVSRGKLFVIQYLGGILVYIVAYGANLLLCLLVAAVNGVANSTALAPLLPTFIINIIMYLFIYSVVTLAVMMTGNLIISILGSLVFLVYVPAVLTLKEGLSSLFFETYYSFQQVTNQISIYASPFMSYSNVVQQMEDVAGNPWLYALIALAEGIVASVGAYFLYKIHPSESAGKAMAFAKSKTVIKVLLVIPISIAGGIFFRELGSGDAWMIFGVICACVISHGLIEILYQFDFRGAINNKRHLIGCATIAAIILSIFRFDIFRYDSYIPKEDKIASMSISIHSLDDWVDYPKTIAANDDSIDVSYYNPQEYQLKNMKLTNLDGAYEMVKEGIAHTESKPDYNRYSNNNSMNGTIFVKYKLTNGSTLYRRYYMPWELIEDEAAILYNNIEFKAGVYPILNAKADDFASIRRNRNFWKLDLNEMEQILSAYQEELKMLTIEDRKNTNPIGLISFVSKELIEMSELYQKTERERGEDLLNNYLTYHPIYPTFVKTIELLEKQGIDYSDILDEQSIQRIEVVDEYKRSDEYQDLLKQAGLIDEFGGYVNHQVTTEEEEEEGRAYYTEPEQIKQIMEIAVSQSLDYYNGLKPIEPSIELKVSVNEKSNVIDYYYSFPLGEIPDFVKKDLLYDEHRSQLDIE